METASFAARRPAAHSLPPFQLPTPTEVPSTRYPSLAPLAPHAYAYAPAMSQQSSSAPPPEGASGSSPPEATSLPLRPPFSTASSSASHPQTQMSYPTPLVSTGTSILTPSAGAPAELSSPSSGINSGSSAPSNPSAPMYYQLGSTATASTTAPWPTPGTAQPYNYSSASPATTGPGSILPSSSSYNRFLAPVSPPLPSFSRGSSSPANGEGLPTPSGYQDAPSFPGSLGGNGGGLAATLGSQGGPAGGPHPALTQPMLNSQAPTAPHQPPTPVSAAGPSPPDSGYRPMTHTPNSYYASTSTPQQTSYPAFAGPAQPSPPIPSPTTTAGFSRSLASIAPQGGMAPPLGFPMAGRSPSQYGSYGQQSLGVLSNIHQPGAPMAMMGVNALGVSQGYGAHPHAHGHTHGHHMPLAFGHGPPQAMQDRPFKCDQCPQSFNRNHDLKRHKRIHLAVKPFPCTFCDKSFSRKDALKRHRLVKGCGEKASEAALASNHSDGSPRDRTDGSDDAGSPQMQVKREQ